MSKEKTFEVSASFVFKGKFFIKASSQEEANKKTEESCGLVLGGNIHSNLNEGDVNWEFDMHPEMIVEE
jgi:hypothetical protein